MVAVGMGVALIGALVSLGVYYFASLPRPIPLQIHDDITAQNAGQVVGQPYHNVSVGGYYQTPWWYEEEETISTASSLQFHVALVTGGNSGIGRAIAQELCKLRVGTVAITSRSLARAQKAAQDMIADGFCQENQLRGFQLDLADFNSVRQLAEDFKTSFDRLNYFVENAGGVFFPGITYQGPYLNKEGYEMLYAGNYLGHFLLLNLLLELIQTSQPARIALTSSIAHWVADTRNLTSLLPESGHHARMSLQEKFKGGSLLSPVWQYGNTKFLQIAMAFELQHRLKASNNSHVTITPLAPGFVNTNIQSGNRDAKATSSNFMASNPTALTPQEGAQTTLHALFSSDIEGKTGYFLQPYWSPLHQNEPPAVVLNVVGIWEWAGQKINWGCYMWLPHPNTHSRSFQRQLWEESLQAVGLS